MNNKKNCEHFAGVDQNDITPKTSGCEECEKEGTDWVALRMCLICGHVGCCDSSIGVHATNHFHKTGHTVMVALPNKQWKWCYVHKQYS
ncbi:MAG: UBP-type zinc finger domain-containing protein [Nitrososphaeraceae archaeon]